MGRLKSTLIVLAGATEARPATAAVAVTATGVLA
jgi:hypothetical protein